MGQTAVKIVAAIDFGTKNSGYAYCLNRNGEIKFDDEWPEGRVSTDILLERHLQVAKAFGPEANELYKQSLRPNTNEELEDCVYLEKIKLQVLLLKDPRDFEVKAVSGEHVHATHAFAAALQLMKERCLKQIKTKESVAVDESEILWILTVPSAWQSAQKGFMSICAYEAGVTTGGATKKFTLLTESETSAEFCRSLSEKSFVDSKLARDHLLHKSYLVVDAGGGTVDISLVSTTDDGELETTRHQTSGGRWGGETVNERFEDFLCSKSQSTKQYVKAFRETFDLWLKFKSDYENRKSQRSEISHDLAVTVDEKLIALYEDVVEEDFFNDMGENTKLKCEGDKIVFRKKYLKRRVFESVFQRWEEMFEEAGEEDVWEKFEDDYRSAEKRFEEGQENRQHDIEIQISSEFLDVFNTNEEVPFERMFSKGKGKGLQFDQKTEKLKIPSHVMRWGYYDEFINSKERHLRHKIKLRCDEWKILMDSFENAKHDFTGDEDLVLDLGKFPQIFRDRTKTIFLNDIKVSGVDIDFTGNTLSIELKIVEKKLFVTVCDNVMRLISEFHEQDPKIKLLYLVGGFSKQIYLQRYIKKEFRKKFLKDIKILVPKEASKSVLKGTILFAYNRVSDMEYVPKTTLFLFQIGSETAERSRPISTGVKRLVKRGQPVHISEIIRCELFPVDRNIMLWSTTDREPKGIANATQVCQFDCTSNGVHVINLSFSNNQACVFVEDKETGTSQLKRVSVENPKTCAIE